MLLRRCTTAVSIMKKANSISRIFGTCCLAAFKYRVPSILLGSSPLSWCCHYALAMKWVHNDLACQQCNILLQRRGCAGRLAGWSGCSLNLNNIQMGSIHSHCCCWLHVPKNSNAHPLFKPFHALLFQKTWYATTSFPKNLLAVKTVLGKRLYLLQAGYERRPFGISSLCDWIQQKSTVADI